VTGVRSEVTVDRAPRTNRDGREIALEAGEFLKRKNPNGSGHGARSAHGRDDRREVMPRRLLPANMRLTGEERVILFCVAVGLDHAASGITAQTMQRMMIKT
jgi:hypothetical protein